MYHFWLSLGTQENLGFGEMYGSNKVSSHNSSEPGDYFLHESFEQHGKILKYVIQYQQKGNLTYGEVVQKFRHDATFRSIFTDIFRDCKFKAYFWETKPVSLKHLDKEIFEFVIIESKQLAQMRPDKESFKEHFMKQKDKPAASFYNLGGDALLVAPTPDTDAQSDYTHLATFIRTAPEEKANVLWQHVGESIDNYLQKNPHDPMWVSTCGTGVGWLHVRLDSRPKYYSYEPYRAYKPPKRKAAYGCCGEGCNILWLNCDLKAKL